MQRLDLSRITCMFSTEARVIHNTGLHCRPVLKGDASTFEAKLFGPISIFVLLPSSYPNNLSCLFPQHTKFMNLWWWWWWGGVMFSFAQRCVCREISKAQQEWHKTAQYLSNLIHCKILSLRNGQACLFNWQRCPMLRLAENNVRFPLVPQTGNASIQNLQELILYCAPEVSHSLNLELSLSF